MVLPSLFLLLQVVAPPGQHGDQALRHRNGRMPRSVTAVRTDQAPRIDGRLDDEIWSRIEPQGEFQRDVPSDGNPATQRTEVRVAYDNDALYVAARLHDDRPDLVSRRLNRRDSFSLFNDVFFVLIDSYHDHRTQFVFGVTPAGERRDAVASGDGHAQFDVGWDPVWEAHTSIDSLGWVAELRIPFSQLRFSPADRQLWGIQFRRDIIRSGEAVDWQWSPRSEPGSASKFGHLLGLEGIPSPRRLELLPYASSQARLTQGLPNGHPFDDGSVTAAAGGLDLKYGLTSDLTLSASINPDFGQVEADPSVVNLTAFETFFQERRPLFVEGSDIFAFGTGASATRFFYSRRIGRAPGQSAIGTTPFVDEPINTSILGAVKLSGRTGSGWSIGALNAVTGREFARVADAPTAQVRRVGVEPLTNYSVLRLRKDGGGGTAGFGFIGTAVRRDVGADAFPGLRRGAYVGAVDFFKKWDNNRYQVDGYAGASRIEGEAAAIGFAQTSSARYYQRPDQSYVGFDPEATSLSGATGQLRINKLGGEWLWGLSGTMISPGYEMNDAGFQVDADRLRFNGSVTRQWTRPSRFARSASIHAGVGQALNFGGTGLEQQYNVQASVQLHSLWSLSTGIGAQPEGLDDRSTRGGPLISRPSSIGANFGFGSDQRKPLVVSLSVGGSRDRTGGYQATAYTTLRLQTPHGARFALEPTYSRLHLSQFYVASYADPTAGATFGQRYLFARLDQHTLSVSARAEFYFNPSLSLQVYAQPFVATADFDAPAALTAPRSYAFDTYGTRTSTVATDPQSGAVTVDADGAGPAPSFTYPNQDFRLRSLRSNVVLRWEYRPGSTLFLVWNQGRQTFIDDARFRPLRDLSGIFGDDMQNVFLVKANWFVSW